MMSGKLFDLVVACVLGERGRERERETERMSRIVRKLAKAYFYLLFYRTEEEERNTDNKTALIIIRV